MSITTEVRKDLIALVVGVYGAAPGTTLLSSLATTFSTSNNLAAVALSMQSTPAFMSAYPSFLTNAEFATRVVDNILEGRVSAADRTWAIDTLIASLNSGAGRAELILTAVIELQRTTNPDWANAKAAFVNQVDVATYHTVTLQKDGTAAERVAVIANVDQTSASVETAKVAQGGPVAELAAEKAAAEKAAAEKAAAEKAAEEKAAAEKAAAEKAAAEKAAEEKAAAEKAAAEKAAAEKAAEEKAAAEKAAAEKAAAEKAAAEKAAADAEQVKVDAATAAATAAATKLKAAQDAVTAANTADAAVTTAQSDKAAADTKAALTDAAALATASTDAAKTASDAVIAKTAADDLVKTTTDAYNTALAGTDNAAVTNAFAVKARADAAAATAATNVTNTAAAADTAAAAASGAAADDAAAIAAATAINTAITASQAASTAAKAAAAEAVTAADAAVTAANATVSTADDAAAATAVASANTAVTTAAGTGTLAAAAVAAAAEKAAAEKAAEEKAVKDAADKAAADKAAADKAAADKAAADKAAADKAAADKAAADKAAADQAAADKAAADKAAADKAAADAITVTASETSVDEGSSAFFTIQTTSADVGKTYGYSISGVSSTDVAGGSLVGSVTIGADGRGLIPVSLVADATTEGAETLTVTVAGKTGSITVNDTSLTPAPTPRAMTLSVNQDSGPDFTGTTVNDTYSALPTTLGTGDSLNGGEGSDTLNLTANLTADVSLAGFSLTSIENINVNLADGDATADHAMTLNMANAGAAAVTVSGLAATTQADGLVLNNLAAGSTLAMSNATNVNLTANFVAAATTGTANAVSVALNGVASTAGTDSTLTIGNGFEILNIAATGSASVLGDVVSNSTQLNVTGDQNLTVRAGLDASLRTIDASAYTGRLSVVLTEPTEATNTNPAFDQADLVVTGGSGNDTINAAAITTATHEIHINAGAGNDTVTIGQALSSPSATNAGDILNGGDGTDTLVYTSAGFAALTAATTVGVSNFETLRVSNALATTITAANVQATGITTVNLAAGGTGGVTMAAGSVNVTLGASLTGALTLTDTGTAITDSITLSNVATAADDMGDINSLIVTGYETLNIVTTAVDDTSQDFNAITLTADTGGTTTVNFSGADRATVGVITAATINASGLTAQTTGTTFDMTAAAASVTTITGSAGADVLRGDDSSTINGGAGNDTIIGGTGADVLNGDDGDDEITTGTSVSATGVQLGDTVNGGAGNDTIIFGDNLDALDRVNGGDGTDTISLTNTSMTAVKAMTISEANAFNANFVSVETLRLTNALDQTSFDLGYMATVTTVRLDAGITGAEAINGFASGGTVDLRAALGDTLTVGVNNAAASATDSFTIRLAESADTDYTAVAIANVETVNIVSTEITASANIRAATLGLTLTQATGGAAQTVNVSGLESLTIDTAIAAGTINASGMTVAAVGDAGLTMGAAFTATTAIPGQTITGSGKVDVLRGSTGADVINAGAGADTVHGSTGADSIDGGDGTDTYSTIAAQVAANIQGAGTGTSTGVAINLGATAVTAAAVNFAMGGTIGLSASSTSLAAGTVQYVFGTQSNFNATTTSTLANIENITLAGNGNNYVVGSATANVIVGGTDIDIIDGGAGNDTITGGTGADRLTGGTGADAFVFAVGASVASTANTLTGGGIAAGNTVTFGGGVDVITDFAVTVDKLDITTAATAPTTLLAIATATALTAGTSYVAYGTWDAAAGAFTIAAAFDATNARDAMLIVDGNGQTAITTTGVVILDNLTAALAAGDII